MTSEKKKNFLLRLNLVVVIAGGLATIWALVQNPGDKDNALFLRELSPAILIIILAIGLILVTAIYLFYTSFRDFFWVGFLGKTLENIFVKKITGYLIFFLLLVSYITLFTSPQTLGSLASYRVRIYPILLWISILTIQLLLTSLSLIKLDALALIKNRIVLLMTAILFGIFLIFVVSIALTKIGIKPDKVLWQEAGVPLIFAQVLLAWIVGLAAYCAGRTKRFQAWFSRKKGIRDRYLDLFICIIIWVIAFALWISYPVKPSYNSLEPRPPNFQSYPFGDSLIYDSNAQGYSLGQPIPNDFAQKPFYSFFLVILHLFAKQDYDLLVQLQVAVFAFIPVIVYHLVKTISNRPTGLVAAILVIFREFNAISLSNVIQVSHSRLLMSDMIAMGLVTLVVLYSIRWLKNPDNNRNLPVIIGGVLGLLVLTRAQALLLLPFLLLAYAIVLFQTSQYRRLVEGSFILVLGLSIPLGVWIWRNYQWTGNLILQEPEHAYSYTDYMAQMYSMNPLEEPTHLPGEDDVAYYERIKNQPFIFTMQHPEEVVRFVSAHFMHNLIYSFIYLPQSLSIEHPIEYVKRMPFWTDWDGRLTNEAKVFTVFNLLILALGTVAFWRKSGRMIFVPLLLWIGYNLSVSLGRLSGWRLILPVDWMTLIFYSIGLVQLALIIRSFFIKSFNVSAESIASPEMGAQISSWNWGTFAFIVFIFGVISLGLTKGHEFFPVRYLERTEDNLLQEYKSLIPGVQDANPIAAERLKDFLEQESAIALEGLGLYPSFIPAGKGELNYFYLAFAPRSYKHLSFQLIGTDETGIVMPMEVRPGSFPNASDVLVFGCKVENEYFHELPGYVDGLLVIVKTNPPKLYSRFPLPELVCPFPAP